jgi:3-oxoacyl-[acyl-carrier protein] reductase
VVVGEDRLGVAQHGDPHRRRQDHQQHGADQAGDERLGDGPAGVGLHGQGGQVNYAASKAGLIGYTKALAKETAGRGVRVNAIAPGYIETEMTGAIPEEARKTWLESIPMKRAGSVTDVADSCVFLASDLSTYITAQVLGVDGGMGA